MRLGRVMRLGKVLGVFELDENGNILYSSLEGGNGSASLETIIKGRNFFAEIADFTNVEQFRRLFNVFRLGDSPASGFDFTCDYPDGPTNVRVLLARSQKDSTHDSFLVHLRKV